MNNAKKRKRRTILGISLMVGVVLVFCWYEWLGGREWVNYTDVLVLKEDVLQGEIITPDKLIVTELDKDLVTKEVLSNPNEIVNKAARHFIPKGTTLHQNYFEEAELVLGNGEYISKIPLEWTLSIPDTLRRGDEIIVYSATYDSEILEALQPKEQITVTSQQEGEPSEETTVQNSAVATDIGLLQDFGGPLEAVNNQGELKELFKTNVAYVKDSSNQEVRTTSTLDRLDASASIANIEIVTTTDEFKALEEQIKMGAKLIVMYSDNQEKQEETEK